MDRDHGPRGATPLDHANRLLGALGRPDGDLQTLHRVLGAGHVGDQGVSLDRRERRRELSLEIPDRIGHGRSDGQNDEEAEQAEPGMLLEEVFLAAVVIIDAIEFVGADQVRGIGHVFPFKGCVETSQRAVRLTRFQ